MPLGAHRIYYDRTMLISKDKSETVDEEFFQKAIDESAIEDIETEQVSSWFDVSEEFQNRDTEFYWIKEPFVFAGLEYTSSGVEYYIFEPTASDKEKKALGATRGEVPSSDRNITQYINELSETFRTEYGGNRSDLDVYKMAYLTMKWDSEERDLYPLFIDDNVVNLTAQENAPVILSIKNPQRRDIITNISVETERFESICTTFSESATDESGSIKKGYISSDIKFSVSKTSNGQFMNVEFYDSESGSITELLATNSLNNRIAAYLWLATDSAQDILISGVPESGKTTLVQAMLDFMPASSRVLAIGDGRELSNSKDNTQHYSWDSFNTDEGLKMVSDALPEYMIFDDITDGFGSNVVFNSVTQGKTVWATLTGRTVNSTIKKLINQPINTSEQQVQEFDILINLRDLRTTKNNRYTSIKRVNTIAEVGSALDSEFSITEVYNRDPSTDGFIENIETSSMLKYIRRDWVLTHETLLEEFERRSKLLEEMANHQIFETSKVRTIITRYRNDPEWFEKKLDDDSTDIKKLLDSILRDKGFKIEE